MSPNQRDLFLWSWSRSRKRGRIGNLLVCAAIGAAGGVLFGLMLAGDVAGGLGPVHEASPSVQTLGVMLSTLGKLFGLAIPAFALLAAGLGDRVFMSQEAMFQNLLRQGAGVPEQKPTLSQAERWPQIAVFVAVGIIVSFIVVVWFMYG